VTLALTPGHDGRFGEDLLRAKTIGAWFRNVRPWLIGAQPAADVAIVHGSGADNVSEALARAGVFSRWIAADQSLPDCRAIILPPGRRMDERLSRYVNGGGTLITFGNDGSARVTVKVDSEYNADFAANNLFDDNPQTAWASGKAPMPHWAEITLPEPVEVQAVELVNRSGAYQVADVDIEIPDGDGWRVAKSIRDAKERTIIATLDTPVKTNRVRVKILRELYEGRDRQHADVAGIRILDRTRHDHAQNPPIFQNKVGKGQMLLVTSKSLPGDAQFLSNLIKQALGEPSYVVSAAQAQRFRFILTQVRDARVLHVIDANVPARDYQPTSVEISLASQQLGGRTQARLAGSGKALKLSQKDGRPSFVVQPNPVATVVFEGGG
jgi:CheY-like chemotaxis protein